MSDPAKYRTKKELDDYKETDPIEIVKQEMLKKNILATNSIYISTSHTKKDLQKYFKILDSTFSIIRKCQKGDDIFRYLNSEISISDFKVLSIMF